MSGLSESTNQMNMVCGVEGTPSTTSMTLDPSAFVTVGGTGSSLTGSEILMWTAVGH